MPKAMWAGAAVTMAAMAGAGQAWARDKPLYQPAPAWVTPAPPIDTSKLGDDAPLVLIWDDQERLADGAVWSTAISRRAWRLPMWWHKTER